MAEENKNPDITPYILNGLILSDIDKSTLYSGSFDIDTIEIEGRNEFFINAIFYPKDESGRIRQEKLKIWVSDDRIKDVLKPNMSIAGQIRICSQSVCKLTKIDLRSDYLIGEVLQCTCCNHITRPYPVKLYKENTYKCPICTAMMAITNNVYLETSWPLTKHLPLS